MLKLNKKMFDQTFCESQIVNSKNVSKTNISNDNIYTFSQHDITF